MRPKICMGWLAVLQSLDVHELFQASGYNLSKPRFRGRLNLMSGKHHDPEVSAVLETLCTTALCYIRNCKDATVQDIGHHIIIPYISYFTRWTLLVIFLYFLVIEFVSTASGLPPRFGVRTRVILGMAIYTCEHIHVTKELQPDAVLVFLPTVLTLREKVGIRNVV